MFSALAIHYPTAKYWRDEHCLKDENYYFYDFTLVDQKKMIEFNGTYWHCDPAEYVPDFYHKNKEMTAQQIWEFDEKKNNFARTSGFEVLIIKESEYTNFPAETIEKCLQFLKSN